MVLSSAVKMGDIETIRNCLSSGATEREKEAALRSAAYLGKIDCVSLLIEYNVNVNAADKYCINSLHLATKREYIDIVKLLCRSGAIVDCETKENVTPLMFALKNGNFEIAEVLVEYGADVNYKITGELDLIKYFMQSLDVVRFLVNHGADFKCAYNDDDPYERYFLIDVAVNNGFFDVAEYLLEQGAQISPFILNGSIYYYEDDKTKWLLEHGVNINAADEDGVTPLMKASQCSSLELVQYLIDCGADIFAVSNFEDCPTALTYAAACYLDLTGFCMATIALLLKNGADPSQSQNMHLFDKPLFHYECQTLHRVVISNHIDIFSSYPCHNVKELNMLIENDLNF